ncbi:MAG: hypothetical protein JXA96_17260 [Sedimentisphaerales bacterium]|nr:hypothetical protein [Sedimentisphaerales bacterium]
MSECNLTEERKKQIDPMSHYEMCHTWRFAKIGFWMVSGECGEYFKKRLFEDLGGFTPEISKSLGWGTERS